MFLKPFKKSWSNLKMSIRLNNYLFFRILLNLFLSRFLPFFSNFHCSGYLIILVILCLDCAVHVLLFKHHPVLIGFNTESLNVHQSSSKITNYYFMVMSFPPLKFPFVGSNFLFREDLLLSLSESTGKICNAKVRLPKVFLCERDCNGNF